MDDVSRYCYRPADRTRHARAQGNCPAWNSEDAWLAARRNSTIIIITRNDLAPSHGSECGWITRDLFCFSLPGMRALALFEEARTSWTSAQQHSRGGPQMLDETDQSGGPISLHVQPHCAVQPNCSYE